MSQQNTKFEMTKTLLKQPHVDLKRLVEYRKELEGMPNMLPFHSILETKTQYILKRPYIYSNLYNRLSTRPFFNNDEKLWVTFQLLMGIESIHTKGIVHGDLKLENLLITSSNWLLVTDFAPYKSIYVPDDDPYIFSQQFDSSFRHCCNTAPERFVHFDKITSDSILEQTMDIFSIGCILAEIYLESPLFTYSQLIQYKKQQYDPSILVKQIKNEDIRKVVLQMIEIDKEKRPTISEVLSTLKSSCFPDFLGQFHSFCHTFNQFDFNHFLNWSVDYPSLVDTVFIGNNLPSLGDIKILKLSQDVDLVLKEPNELKCQLYATLTLSWIRNVQTKYALISGFKLLNKLCTYLSDTFKLERCIPFYNYFCKSENPLFSFIAIYYLNLLLQSIDDIPPTEANLFISYLLPNFSQLAKSNSELIKHGLSCCIGNLAVASKKFINKIDDYLHELLQQEQFTYDASLVDLQEQFQDIFLALVTSSSRYSKSSLLLHSYPDLVPFFGKTISDQNLIAHLSTFISDQDRDVKQSLYICVYNLNEMLPEPLLTTFLLNGLSDPHLDAVYLCLQSSLICDLSRSFSLSYLTLASVYLLHSFLRTTTLQVFLNLFKNLSNADILTLLQTTLKPFTLVTLFEPKWLQDMLIDPIDFYSIYAILNKNKVQFKAANVFEYPIEKINSLNKVFTDIQACCVVLNSHFVNNTQDNLEFEFIYNQLKHYTLLLQSPFPKLKEEWVFDHFPKSSQSLCVDLNIFMPLNQYEGLNKHLKQYAMNKYHIDHFYAFNLQSYSSQHVINSLKGIRISKLVEHNGSINSIKTSADSTWFASGSSDGTVKLWDPKRLERNTSNTSKLTIPIGGDIHSLQVLGNDSIMAANYHKIQKYDLNRMQIIDSITAHCMAFQSYGSMAAYCTINNEVYLNADQYQKLKIPTSLGLTTSIALDKHLLSIGTSRGNIITYDIRFMSQISAFCIPSANRITNLVFHNSILVVTSTSGELSQWNVSIPSCTHYVNDIMMDSKCLPLNGKENKLSSKMLLQDYMGLSSIFCTSDGILAGSTNGGMKVILNHPVVNEKQEYIDIFNGKYKQIPPMYTQIVQDGIHLHDDAINAIEFTNIPYPMMITGCQDGSIYLWK